MSLGRVLSLVFYQRAEAPPELEKIVGLGFGSQTSSMSWCNEELAVLTIAD